MIIQIILGVVSAVLISAYELSPHGVIVNVADNSTVELAVEGMTSFRISVSYGDSPVAIDSPMIDKHIEYSNFTVIHEDSIVGLRTSFGEVLLDSKTGGFAMVDSKGKNITTTNKLSQYVVGQTEQFNDDICLNYQKDHDKTSGTRVPSYPNGLKGQTQQSCCTICNNDMNCTIWIFATDVSPADYNCWLMLHVDGIKSRSNRVIGGAIPEQPKSIRLSLGRSAKALFYGSGAHAGNTRTLPKTNSIPNVANRGFETSHYYSTDGYAALGVTSHSYDQQQMSHYPATWDARQKGTVSWMIAGNHVDLYLMPSSTHADGLSAYWDLTGRPVVLPRFAYGFLACRWGWVDDQYIWDTLSRFRNESYPLDAWISDYGWYTPTPDSGFPDTGSPDYKDFSYNSKTFPNPSIQFKDYREKLHLKFGGIRKPRLGNSNLLIMAKNNNWTVESAKSNIPEGTKARNLNFSRPDVRDWYQKQHAHYLKDGVEFWWNDEGEAFYFLYYWWNIAEINALTNHDSNKRYFSISRAYTPGMQRFGSVIWTGDISVSWNSLNDQPGYVLNWNLAGSMHVTCDTGGFEGSDDTALLLTRWYQFAVFMPVMRVHSRINNLPHFPFLYGPEAGNAMRIALNLRYRLIPYHYSLAHQGYRIGGKPIMRPLLWDFGNDAIAAQLTSQWMDGDYLMPVPVMKRDNSTTVYLPLGQWYIFNTTSILRGPQTLNLTSVPLDHIIVYVKAGGVIPLGPVIQYSDQLPGGPIEIQIYPGDNGSFVMFEDDGVSKDYQIGMIKETQFLWTDKNKTLSWITQGSFKDAHIFTEVQAVVFFSEGEKRSTVQPLTDTGYISF